MNPNCKRLELFRIEKVIKRGKKKSLEKMILIKNIMLPNKPLSNFKLEDAARRLKIPSFRGVFLLDTLPKKPNKKECGIVNFNKSGGPGTHWVAWYKNGKTKIYFDSYGV